MENTAFDCLRCGARVRALTSGSFRNHCPECLWSKHVDVRPGDRAADCGGPMRPVGVDHRRGKGPVLVHCCQSCGHRSVNRAALDDPVQPDSAAALGTLMAQQFR
ncbi:RNHCP domain-containing protein [Nakamurella lactea]|uniref:RNHCP domain-containing protein n=1 Tax=Nakamurella lactea TaxID=459515 RepID=UPI002481551D|nr:RNHCP domain-containing protein [Nakamurella lactea]